MTAAPTIHEVARAAGVSASTVSRSLLRPERVNPLTRERVRGVAEQLGYSPSPQARSLLSGRSMTLALVLPDITNPFFFGLIRGAQGAASAAGYTQVLLDSGESVDLEREHLTLARKSVDGVVLAASRLTDAQLAAVAARQPLVAINRDVAGVESVVIDTPAGYREAVRHLAALGHTAVLYVAGPAFSWSDGRRWRAVHQAARRAGLGSSRIGPYPPTRAGGAAAADAVADLGATAVLAFDDLQALGILARLAERGVDVPGRVSVVGCDDIFGADFCHPPLTTIGAPVEQAGRLATALLLHLLGVGEDLASAGRTPLPSSLHVRASTGPAPTAPAPTGPAPISPTRSRGRT